MCSCGIPQTTVGAVDQLTGVAVWERPSEDAPGGCEDLPEPQWADATETETRAGKPGDVKSSARVRGLDQIVRAEENRLRKKLR